MNCAEEKGCSNNRSGVLSDFDIKRLIESGEIKIGVSGAYKKLIFDDENTEKMPKFNLSQIGPCSIDLRLGYDIVEYKIPNGTIIDFREFKKNGGIPKEFVKKTMIPFGEGIVLEPHHCYLGTTIESVVVPRYLRAIVEGKSTLGRFFIIPHAAAGYIDPGFGLSSGCTEYGNQITLEIVNLNDFAIRFYPGDFICQLEYASLMSESENSYDKRISSLYVNQVGTKMPITKNLVSI